MLILVEFDHFFTGKLGAFMGDMAFIRKNTVCLNNKVGTKGTFTLCFFQGIDDAQAGRLLIPKRL